MESFWIQAALTALKSFSFVYDVITFPIYLLLQRPWKRRVMSRRIKVS
jgi:long-chain acyl-CoA synthetase